MSEAVVAVPNANIKRVYAGFWLRSLAHFIDFVLVNGVELAIEYGISTPLQLSGFAQQVVGVFFSVALAYWYYCVYQVRTGSTFGKKIFGISVIDEKTGNTLSRKQSIIRLVGYLGSYAIIGCGFLMAAFSPEKKALHDLFAGTVSVRLEQDAKSKKIAKLVGAAIILLLVVGVPFALMKLKQ